MEQNVHFCNHQKRVFDIHMVRASVFFTGGKHIKRTQHINKTIVEKEKKNSNAFHSSCVASGILMTEDCGVLSFCLSLHMGVFSGGGFGAASLETVGLCYFINNPVSPFHTGTSVTTAVFTSSLHKLVTLLALHR